MRNVVYFAAMLLRYVLMIIGMGMDWFMLLSVVGGLTLGHLLTDIYTRSSAENKETEYGRAEEVELLHRAEEFDVEEEDEGKKLDDGDYAGGGAHRRSTSRNASLSVGTPY